MANVCHFCDQEFANAQAVRAHLKACLEYQRQKAARPEAVPFALGTHKPKGSAGSTFSRGAGSQSDPSADLVRHLETQVAAGRLGLTLRELDEANAELDRRAEIKKQERLRGEVSLARQSHAADRADSERRARDDASRRERERREARLRECRTLIQEIKQQVITEPGAWLLPSAEAKSGALQEVERALSSLKVDELPREELLIVARTARDAVYREAERANKAARDADQERRLRALAIAQRKKTLIEKAVEYVKEELASLDGLNALQAWRIERRVELELQNIEGSEGWYEIEGRVEDILASEGIESEEDEDGDEF